MGKISDYGRVRELKPDNIFLVDGGGTKTIMASELYYAMIDSFAPVELRRNTFRGLDLGTVVTAEQKANIQNGSFKGLFIGDFWTLNGHRWRIADINYWYNTGDTIPRFDKPHLVIISETVLYTAYMNPTDITTGGYLGSYMHTEGLNVAKGKIQGAFGDLLLTHRMLLSNNINSNGLITGGTWVDSTVELPSDTMIFGSKFRSDFSISAGGQGISQLSLMKIHPKFINITAAYWLQDPVASDRFQIISGMGMTSTYLASATNIGVRPVFTIG